VTASSLMRTDKANASGTASPQAASNAVKLERQGQMRWLSTTLPPEQLWGQVRNFWSEMGFELTTDAPDVGVMETNFAENRVKVPKDGAVRQALGRVFDMLYDTGERDQYRTRIERTATGSEIYISHKGLIEEYEDPNKKDRTTWRNRPSDPGLEAEMLSRLMLKLGAPKEAANAVKAELPVAAAPVSSFARLNADGVSLTVEADYDTAWRRVGLALDRSGFTVENRDRKQGAFEVRLSDNDPDAAKPGFFARLFGAKEENQDGLSRYKVVVQSQGAGKNSLVSVLKDNGQPTTSNTAKRIAKQLLDELT
jgi:outer membrane protein assembly factor BamC